MTRKRCEHYWLIEPPAGPTSEGTCRKCGEERVFSNVWIEGRGVKPVPEAQPAALAA